MNRKYIAMFDNGHDYFTVEYYSSHRAGSKANAEDAKDAMHRKLGWSRKARLVSVERYDW